MFEKLCHSHQILSFSNSLIIHKVNYKSLHVHHITCMCLDTQRKTVYHFPVKVVYTTKICTTTIAQNQWIFVTPFVFKVTPIRVASFISASKIRRNVTNLTKRKKNRSIKNNRYKLFTRTKFYPLKIQLPFGRTCPWVQCDTSFTSKRWCFNPQIIEYNEREG